MKQKLIELKREIDSNTIMVADFNIQLSVMDTATRQKINKGIEELNIITNQLALTDIYRTLPNKQATHSS